MTIAEAENFYAQDEEKYIVSKNKDLLNFFKSSMGEDYYQFVDLNDLQKFIDSIAYWYEMKYPEREICLRDNQESSRTSLANLMTMEQLLLRLGMRQFDLMKCYYRSNKGVMGSRSVYGEGGSIIGSDIVISIPINRKFIKDSFDFRFFFVDLNINDGMIKTNYDLEKYISDEKISLDDLLEIFKNKYSSELDYSNLEECQLIHNRDLELRNKMFELVALKLLYSKDSIPERGYKRAKIFIDEFNNDLGLNLTTDELNEIVSRNYSKRKEERLTQDDNNKKVKRLTKSIFKKHNK